MFNQVQQPTQFPLGRGILVRLNEARMLGKAAHGPSPSFPPELQFLNKCLSARIKNLYGRLSVHIRVTLSSDSNARVLVVMERFWKELRLYAARIQVKG